MTPTNEVAAFLKWLAEVIVAASVVIGTLWRVIERMISKKVEAQIAKLAEKVTAASSEGMEKLRDELAQNRQAQIDHTNDRFDRLTERIDSLLNRGGRY